MTVNDAQPTVSWRREDAAARLDGHRAAGGPAAAFDGAPQAPGEDARGLVNLGFLAAALWRARRACGALAVVGLIGGAAFGALVPPPYSATVTVLVDNPGDDDGSMLQTDLTLAQSTPVAQAVIAQLGLHQTPASFMATYTATQVTSSVLSITVTGPSDAGAVRRAAAIAAQFLAFRATYLQEQQQATDTGLAQQVTAAQSHLDAVDGEITKVSAQPASSSQRSKLASLRSQQADAANTVSEVKAFQVDTQAQGASTTTQMINASQVLSPATAAKRSLPKTLLLYAGEGLLGGLMIGVALVVLVAITSDRLRRRDDIAYALAAPVRLSLGPLRARRLSLPPRRKAAARRAREVNRFVEHLRAAVPERAEGDLATLAVVAVDDAPSCAEAVVELARSAAEEGTRVILADFSPGAPAARRLGITQSGPVPDMTIRVVVPGPGEVAPTGPVQAPPAGHAPVSTLLADAAALADLVLCLVSLDPAVGGDYLRTWVTDAVAAVTAGRSCATRIRAAGEMVRLAGVRLGSVIVIDADPSDETLGAVEGERRLVPAVAPEPA